MSACAGGEAAARLSSPEPGFAREKARRAVARLLEAMRGVTLGGG